MNIMYGNNHVGFDDAIFISIVSMAIVFLVLILISFLLSLLKFIPTEKKTVSKKNKDCSNSFSKSNRKTS